MRQEWYMFDAGDSWEFCVSNGFNYSIVGLNRDIVFDTRELSISDGNMIIYLYLDEYTDNTPCVIIQSVESDKGLTNSRLIITEDMFHSIEKYIKEKEYNCEVTSFKYKS